MPDAIGVDVFAGGLSVGVQRHFNVVAHYEHGAYGANVVRLNHPEIRLFQSASEWPRAPRFPGRRERVRFIFANPPCAPWSSSSAGRSCPWHADPRVQMFRDAVDLLPSIGPDVLAVESVTNAWTIDDSWGRELAKTVLLHDAQWLGVPQARRRLFYVFHRVAVAWLTPDFTRRTTVREAWRGLRVPASTKKTWDATISQTYRALALETRQGETMAKAFNRLYPEPELNHRGQVKGRPSFLVRRLALDKPSCVVLGEQKLIHPTENRVLYPEELAALVGFPRDYRWPTDERLSKIALMMSQGVSPIVGAWLAEGVAASIERSKRLNRPFLAVQDYRTAPGSYHVLDEDPEAFEVPVRPPWNGPDRPVRDDPPVARRRAEAPVRTVTRQPQTLGSGAFIRSLLVEGGHTTQEILEAVHARFPGRKTTAADVAWNKGRLRKEGVAI